MVLETLIMLCVTGPDFLEKLLPPKLVKWTKKKGFLNLKKNLVKNFPWICHIMKIYLVSSVPAQILYLRKILYLRCRPKWSQPIRFQDFLINHFFKANSMKQPNSFHVDTNSQKLKVDGIFFGWKWSKNECGQSDLWTLKLTVISRMNWWN